MGYRYHDGQEKNRLIRARWFLTLLTGVLTAFVAVFLLYCTTLLFSLKHTLLKTSIQREQAHEWPMGASLALLLSFNVALVAVAAACVCFGEPVAAGSGPY